jgi:hypothetical protein
MFRDWIEPELKLRTGARAPLNYFKQTIIRQPAEDPPLPEIFEAHLSAARDDAASCPRPGFDHIHAPMLRSAVNVRCLISSGRKYADRLLTNGLW